MKRKKRSNASLIEVVVALSLTALLLGALFAFPLFSNRREREAAARLAQVNRELAVEQRLAEVLTEATLGCEGWFYTSEVGLLFSYNNGVDKEPIFSAEVLGMLYLDEGRLILATWPQPHRWQLASYPYRQEVLMDGIASVKMEFLEPPALPVDQIDPDEITEGHEKERIPAGWQATWKQTYQELPALVRLTLERPDEGECVFEFALAEADKPPRFDHIRGSRS